MKGQGRVLLYRMVGGGSLQGVALEEQLLKGPDRACSTGSVGEGS